jgi:hypothetical protein
MMGRNRGERVKKRKNIMLQIFPPADKVPRTKNGAEVQMMMIMGALLPILPTGSPSPLVLVGHFTQPDRG